MIYAAIAPQAALRSAFGATLEGPVAEIVVRNWGVLIALVGVMLIYGAFNPPTRLLVLTLPVSASWRSSALFLPSVLNISGIRLVSQLP